MVIAELAFRFVIGGLVVCAFAAIGQLLKPKSFAGIFGAAPSVALATLGLGFLAHGGSYVALEGRSMIAGAIALFAYSLVVGELLFRRKVNALAVTIASAVTWFALAFGIWGVVFR